MAKKSKDLKYYEAVGRRKSARALTRLYIVTKDSSVTINYGKTDGLKIKAGEIFVNRKPIADLFPGQFQKAIYLKPLILTDCVNRFAISVIVNGGGKTGQLEAVTFSIARALEKVNPEQYRLPLRQAGLLTRDPRVRERRKVGTGGKARRAKQSPKR